MFGKSYLDGFVLSIVAVAVFAAFVPATGTFSDILAWAVKISIALLFFSYGAKLSTAEAIAGLKHWRLHSVVLAVTYIAFPLLGLALVVLSPSVLTPDLYTGVLYLCLVPSTVQSSIVFTSIAKGNVAAAVVSASASNLLGVFLTPLLVIALMNSTGNAHVDLSAVGAITVQLLLPFVLGQCARPLLAGFMKRHAGTIKYVDRSSILLVVYLAFSQGVVEGIWDRLTPGRIAALVAVCAGLLTVVLVGTIYLGRALNFAREDRVVIAFCGSKKSLASGLPMASVLFAGHPVGLIVLPLMLFHQIQLVVCAILAQRWGRAAESRHRNKECA